MAEVEKELNSPLNEINECEKTVESADSTCSSKNEKEVFEEFEVELDFESDVKEVEKESEKEDGEIIGEKKKNTENELEDDEDEGECKSDDDELEEGEIKHEIGDTVQESKVLPKYPTSMPVCRFYNRGKCTYGSTCRFLHVNSYEKENYGTFPQYKPFPKYSSYIRPHNDRFLNEENYSLYQPVKNNSMVDDSWTRDLHAVKEIVQKATMRNCPSPEYRKKRFNSSRSPENLVNNKENKNRRKRRIDESYDDEFPEPPHKCRKHVKNSKSLNKNDLYSNTSNKTEQDKNKKRTSRKVKRRHDSSKAQNTLARKSAEDWVDPYRRSISPKKRSRSRSSSSCSTVSTSYSEKSSYSYSKSSVSSRSSVYNSSRSPSPFNKKKVYENPFLPTDNKNDLLKKTSIKKSSSLSVDSITSDSNHSLSDSSTDMNYVSKEVKKEIDMPKKYESTSVFSECLSTKDSLPTKSKYSHLMPDTKQWNNSVKKQTADLNLIKNQSNKYLKESDVDVKCEPVDDLIKSSADDLNEHHSSPSSLASFSDLKNSRRDELLKQLKAVEDAIARKRSKV